MILFIIRFTFQQFSILFCAPPAGKSTPTGETHNHTQEGQPNGTDYQTQTQPVYQPGHTTGEKAKPRKQNQHTQELQVK